MQFFDGLPQGPFAYEEAFFIFFYLSALDKSGVLSYD